jgi:hypothetical protein
MMSIGSGEGVFTVSGLEELSFMSDVSSMTIASVRREGEEDRTI